MRKNERQGFENLRRIIKVERRGSRGDKTYEETAYYISSLTESAQVFAKIIRGHWKIENQLHWLKDVIFGSSLLGMVRSGGRNRLNPYLARDLID